MKSIQRYWFIWWRIAQYAIAETFLNRGTNILFMTGKVIRFAMLFFFLILIRQNIQHFAGYSTDQIIIFFLTYQFLDTVSQVIYRGVYEFSWQVRSGELDFYLAKPISPLFRILTGRPDVLDAIFLIPTTALSIWIAAHLGQSFTLSSVLLYLALVINGFLIVTSLHILVVCLGVVTTEVDNAIMLYRDMNSLARFPVDVYKEPFRTILFFVVPIGMMNTIPSEALLNVKLTYTLPIVFGVGLGFFLISMLVWKLSLKKYTSAG